MSHARNIARRSVHGGCWRAAAKAWLAGEDRADIVRRPCSAHERFRKSRPIGCPSQRVFFSWLLSQGVPVDTASYGYCTKGEGSGHALALTGVHGMPEHWS